jgi:hypothetical protein
MTTTYCNRCERPVRPAPTLWHEHVVHGTSDLGWFPIGADCARILRAEGVEVERLAVTA